ncbi:hypothetical protein OG741_37630 [Streptomyces sp. NBC_01410]|uniref:hypothetical protein n=1 Tax=Streptomyces sp. NBC_01410 TaxID=2903856 RepID=UPI00324B4646
MEIHRPIPGSVCLPIPAQSPLPLLQLMREAIAAGLASAATTVALRRRTRPLRTAGYTAAGLGAGIGAALLGADVVEAASLGVSVTTSLFTLSPLPGEPAAVQAAQPETLTAAPAKPLPRATGPRRGGHHRWARSARRIVERQHGRTPGPSADA